VLLYLRVFVFVAVCGAGRFSVDTIRAQRRKTLRFALRQELPELPRRVIHAVNTLHRARRF
jgi:hypothetical protein